MVLEKSLYHWVRIVDFGEAAIEIPETRAPRKQSYSATAGNYQRSKTGTEIRLTNGG
jgi:hypothetical protein